MSVAFWLTEKCSLNQNVIILRMCSGAQEFFECFLLDFHGGQVTLNDMCGARFLQLISKCDSNEDVLLKAVL